MSPAEVAANGKWAADKQHGTPSTQRIPSACIRIPVFRGPARRWSARRALDRGFRAIKAGRGGRRVPDELKDGRACRAGPAAYRECFARPGGKAIMQARRSRRYPSIYRSARPCFVRSRRPRLFQGRALMERLIGINGVNPPRGGACQPTTGRRKPGEPGGARGAAALSFSGAYSSE